jgi:hypothetical protein
VVAVAQNAIGVVGRIGQPQLRKPCLALIGRPPGELVVVE